LWGLDEECGGLKANYLERVLGEVSKTKTKMIFGEVGRVRRVVWRRSLAESSCHGTCQFTFGSKRGFNPATSLPFQIYA
jgi:hypothetical protein